MYTGSTSENLLKPCSMSVAVVVTDMYDLLQKLKYNDSVWKQRDVKMM